MTEAAEALFGDSCLNLALENNATTFSSETDSELRKLHSLIQASLGAEAKVGTAAVMASAEWAEVRALANRILCMIEKAKNGTDEE